MLKFGVRGEFLRAITCGVQKKALTLQRIWERQRALRDNKVFKDAENDSVAQLVEQMTLNHWVVGSSPTGVTSKRPCSTRPLFFFSDPKTNLVAAVAG